MRTFKYIMIFISILLSTTISMSTAYADSVDNGKVLVESKWEIDRGIRVLSIRQTAAGYMLDFRYKIIDSDKAAKLLNRKNKAQISVLKNGSTLRVPVASKIGPLRQTAVLPKVGKNYFMFFANPGRIVKSGDKVKIKIGEDQSDILIIN